MYQSPSPCYCGGPLGASSAPKTGWGINGPNACIGSGRIQEVIEGGDVCTVFAEYIIKLNLIFFQRDCHQPGVHLGISGGGVGVEYCGPFDGCFAKRKRAPS